MDTIHLQTRDRLSSLVLELFPDGDPQAAAGTVSMQESQTRPGYYIGVSDDGLSGWHAFVGTAATGRVR